MALDETDALLEEAWALNWPEGTAAISKDSLYRTRDLYRAEAQRNDRKIIRLRVDHFDNRVLLWEQVFRQTQNVLQQLHDLHGLPAMHDESEHVQTAARRYPATMTPLLKWLRDNPNTGQTRRSSTMK